MTDIYTVSYIKNFFGLGSDKKFVALEDYKNLKKELEKEKKLNANIKARFVECNTCTPDNKKKCLMFSENLCEGERCNELVDLVSLLDKGMDETLKRGSDEA